MMALPCRHLLRCGLHGIAVVAGLSVTLPAFAQADALRLAQLTAAAPLAADAAPAGSKPAVEMTMSTFLDKLMQAESSGRDDARNPLSTAVGPYQFIESTWLDIIRRHFATETQGLSQAEVLALRMDRAVARWAAEVYTQENAAVLKASGLEATFPNLRLAFLLGPQGAIRVLQAPANTRVATLLGLSVIRANPFLSGMTADGLIQRAARDLALPYVAKAAARHDGAAPSSSPAGSSSAPKPRPPRVVVQCNLDLPACRRWQALALSREPDAKGTGRQQAAAKPR